MKKLLFLALIGLFSCSDDGVSPIDISGTWKFQIPKHIGKFDIAKNEDGIVLKNVLVDNVNWRYEISNPLNQSIGYIVLQNNNDPEDIIFVNCVLSQDGALIKTDSVIYMEGTFRTVLKNISLSRD